MTKATTKQPIFAYLRQSTKNKQKMSLANQFEDVNDIIEKYDLDPNNIVYFKEKQSAWKSAIRPEFDKMITAIKKSSQKCIIVAREDTRLTRNISDCERLRELLHGYSKTKRNIEPKIEKMIFVDKIFDKRTSGETFYYAFVGAYGYSEKTSIGVVDMASKALNSCAYPYNRRTLPKGLSIGRYGDYNYITENSDMPYIIEAFKMKSKGKPHKEILQYLALYNIKIDEGSLTKNIFNNTKYIGKGIQPSTGIAYTIKFLRDGALTKETPISADLWDKAQEMKGKKHSSYGGKFTKSEKLPVKTTQGRTMSRILGKDQYHYYTISGAETLNIAEWLVIKKYLEFMKSVFLRKRKTIQKIVITEYTRQKDLILNQLSKLDIFIIHEGKDISITRNGICNDQSKAEFLIQEYLSNEAVYELVISEGGEGTTLEVQEAQFYLRDSSTTLIQGDIIDQLDKNLTELIQARKQAIRDNENRLNEIEAEKRSSIDLMRKRVFTPEEFTISKQDLEEEEIRLISENKELREGSELDKYLVKIPTLLMQSLELLGNAIFREAIQPLSEDVRALIKLTTLELAFDNKKELKVKLIDGLREIFLGESPNGAQEETGTPTPRGNGF